MKAFNNSFMPVIVMVPRLDATSPPVPLPPAKVEVGVGFDATGNPVARLTRGDNGSELKPEPQHVVTGIQMRRNALMQELSFLTLWLVESEQQAQSESRIAVPRLVMPPGVKG